jgi:MFS transporter, SP family, arabinose:H+ symporter
MHSKRYLVMMIALIVALGGLLMGFDASVISGVLGFIEPEFGLTKLQLGWSVASLTLTSTVAMMISGPISDRFGRRSVLRVAAILFAISALGSALAQSFFSLVLFRMIGGFGVGASLILAPLYIAEIAPAKLRGRLVSFNQLNIVIGISLAFFSNYYILQLGKSDVSWIANLKFNEYNWRWMLGLEIIPAALYFVGLFFVPRSPRWLIMNGKLDEARKVIAKYSDQEEAEIKTIIESFQDPKERGVIKIKELFKPALRLVLTIGVVIAVLQQITGINSVFFYAPMIFEQTGIGVDASFVQAIAVGVTNLVFTILAILFIDKLGRKPLLVFGLAGIFVSMTVLSYGFYSATYSLTPEAYVELSNQEELVGLEKIIGETYTTDVSFFSAVSSTIGDEALKNYKSDIISLAVNSNSMLILFAILGFVGSFAISLGPVMWVLFSEIFPSKVRALAISFVGLINSFVSFIVQWVFPWELEVFGNATTFFIYGLFAMIGLVFVIRTVPETKGKTLEEIEAKLLIN